MASKRSIFPVTVSADCAVTRVEGPISIAYSAKAGSDASATVTADAGYFVAGNVDAALLLTVPLAIHSFCPLKYMVGRIGGEDW